MVYKRYIYKNGKKFGPYYYESFRDKHGNTHTKYVEHKQLQHTSSNDRLTFTKHKTLFVLLAAIFAILFAILFLNYQVSENNTDVQKSDSFISSIGKGIYSFVTGFTSEGSAPEGESSSSDAGSSSGESDSGSSASDISSESSPEVIPSENNPDSVDTGIDSSSSSDSSVVEGNDVTPEIPSEEVVTVENSDNDISSENNDSSVEVVPEGNESDLEVNETVANSNESVISNESSNFTETPDEEGSSSGGSVFFNNETNQTEIPNINETVTNATNFTINNETVVIENVTIVNQTNATTEVSVRQYGAVLGKPVRWEKKVKVVEGETDNLIVDLPKEAGNVSVKKIKDGREEEIDSFISDVKSVEEIEPVKNESEASEGNLFTGAFNLFLGFFRSITGRAIDSGQDVSVEINSLVTVNEEVVVEYYTDAPYSIENELPNGKEVKIVGLEEVHYENVLVFTELSETLEIVNPSKVRVYWKENETYITPESVKDLNDNGVYDYVEWVAPHLSNQTFEIIVITAAQHLDLDRNFISDIYSEVKSLDENWSEIIPSGDYVRVTFEINLTSANDITVYPRFNNSNIRIEVYEANSSELIAVFTDLVSEEYNKIYLTNLSGEQDTFDLKIVDGDVEFDHIIDPTAAFNDGSAVRVNTAISGASTLASVTTSLPAGNNIVLAAVQVNSTDTGTESIAIGDLKLNIQGGATLSSNEFTIPVLTAGTHNSYFLIGVDSGASANAAYNVTAITSADVMFGEAKIIPISGVTNYLFAASGSAAFDNIDYATLSTLSTSFPAGDNIILASFHIDNGISAQDIAAGDIRIEDSATNVIASNQYAISLGTAAPNDTQSILIIAKDTGAPANEAYSMKIMGQIGSGDAEVKAIAFQVPDSVFTDGGSIAITTAVKRIANVSTTFSVGDEVVVIAAAQFEDSDSAIETILVNRMNITEDGRNVSTNQLGSQAFYVSGTASDGFRHTLLWRNASVAANPQYNFSVLASATGLNGEAKMLVLKLNSPAPKWQTNSTNSTQAGQTIKHIVNWTDDSALSGYIFAFDNGTGVFTNDSWVPFTGTQNWSNISKFVNISIGTTIKWTVYANDSSNGWNSTGNLTYVTTSRPPNVTLYSPSTGSSLYSSQPAQFICNVTDDYDIVNISLYGNFSGTWLVNSTITLGGTQTTSNVTFNVTGLTDSTYLWNCLSYDNDTQIDWGDSNNTLAFDNCNVVQVSSTTVLTSGDCSYYNFTADNIYLSCGYNTIHGENNDSFWGVQAKNRNNVTVKDCNLQQYAKVFLMNGTNNSLLTNNTLYNNSHLSTGNLNTYGFYLQNANNITVNLTNMTKLYTNSTASNCVTGALYGLYVINSTNMTINNSLFTDINGQYGEDGDPEGGGCQFFLSSLGEGGLAPNGYASLIFNIVNSNFTNIYNNMFTLYNVSNLQINGSLFKDSNDLFTIHGGQNYSFYRNKFNSSVKAILIQNAATGRLIINGNEFNNLYSASSRAVDLLTDFSISANITENVFNNLSGIGARTYSDNSNIQHNLFKNFPSDYAQAALTVGENILSSVINNNTFSNISNTSTGVAVSVISDSLNLTNINISTCSRAFSLQGDNINVINSTITNCVNDSYIVSGSDNISFYNVSFNKSKVEFVVDGSGSLKVYYLFAVNVTDQNDVSISSANVDVANRYLSLLWDDFTTGANGLTSYGWIQEYNQTGDATYSSGCTGSSAYINCSTPHNVTVSKTGFTTNSTNITVDQNKVGKVVISSPYITAYVPITDSFSISEPSNQTFSITYINVTPVTIRWTVGDVQQTSYINNSQFIWLGNYSQAGTYTIKVNVTDQNGAYDEQIWTMTVLNTYPKVNLDLVYPTGNINATKHEFFNVTLNVTCSNADCGNINVSLYDNSSLVNITSGEVPFYTNMSNPYTLVNLNISNYQLVNFWVNATGTVGNIYQFYAAANLTSNMSISNMTSNWLVNITNPAISISLYLSPKLAQQINWTLVSLPTYNLSAEGNNGSGITEYYVNVSVTGGTADIYMKANDNLRTLGGDILGIGNETYSLNYTNSSVPSDYKTAITTNYADNKIGDALTEGGIVYLKFFLNAPSAQPAGVYNNSLLFKAVAHGVSP